MPENYASRCTYKLICIACPQVESTTNKMSLLLGGGGDLIAQNWFQPVAPQTTGGQLKTVIDSGNVSAQFIDNDSQSTPCHKIQ